MDYYIKNKLFIVELDNGEVLITDVEDMNDFCLEYELTHRDFVDFMIKNKKIYIYKKMDKKYKELNKLLDEYSEKRTKENREKILNWFLDNGSNSKGLETVNKFLMKANKNEIRGIKR